VTVTKSVGVSSALFSGKRQYSKMEDHVENGLEIAAGYRDATELDTMDLLNAQSRSSGGDGSVVNYTNAENGTSGPIMYFLVGSVWLKRAWHHVLKYQAKCPPNWIEIVGPIDNSALVETAAEDGHNSTSQSAGMPTGTTEDSKPLSNLQHERDFFLLGSRSWMLLSHKFGATHTLPAQTKVHKTNESKLAVDPYYSNKGRTISYAAALDATKTVDRTGWVPIPGTGRFPYEQTSLNDYNPLEDSSIGQMPQQNQQQNPLLPRFVEQRQQVSDSESDANSNVAMKDASSDGVPEDDEIEGHTEENTLARVVLLPPSTTAQTGDDSDNFGFGPTNANDSDNYWSMESEPVEPAPEMKTITTLKRYRYGSGLGNLGNTCFMNSTLQCLGHSHALQRYFLSGDYRQDLNRDNPLGTGGELASAFAKLLTEMWSEETSLAVDASTNEERTVTFTNSRNVVYPREFKTILGRHAEQFMGYDQHDSQEFATYLLDALHEDTNRITKKPYIEKPEQEDGESDEQAADKAWGLHLQRENSRVLENFMGQVKSRVKCCEPGCGRVSTTFDPFMYLSVPIPGSLERTLSVVFVPLDPAKRSQKLSISIPKTAKISELLKRTRDEVLKFKVLESENVIATEDMVALDVWNKDIYSWYNPEEDIERIRDNDETFVYQVRTAAELRAQAEKKIAEGGDEDLEMYNLKSAQKRHYTLDLPTLTQLNKGDEWSTGFGKYLQNHLGFLNAFNANKGTTEDRVKLYERAQTFLKLCYSEVEGVEGANDPQPNVTVIQELEERCASSPVFENVRSIHDLAIIEFCLGKMRSEILRLIKAEKTESPGGVKIAVRMRNNSGSVGERSGGSWVCNPLIIRIPTSMTVHDLRKEIASRLSRSLPQPGEAANRSSTPASGQATSEEEANEAMGATSSLPASYSDSSFGPHEEMLMRRLPLTYDRKSPNYATKSYDSSPLGSIDKSRFRSVEGRPAKMASPRDPEEQHIVARMVGDSGTVFVEWTPELIETSLDVRECNALEDPEAINGEGAGRDRKDSTKNVYNVLDCVEKYCQEEQLEETEMWYCSQCKKHVRAWKQFRLYRMPPILIVHLKRFQYSATSHRRDKISQFIDFPLTGLDLTEQVMGSDSNKKPIYDCFAVSNHYGGLGGGHYTAHALNDDGVWCYYDDSRVSVNVDPKEAVTDAAYVLYYRRRDLDVNEDFLLKIKTPEPETCIVKTAPTVISDVVSQKAAVAASNAAVVDDDNMDVDDTASRCTSVMGSMDEADEFERDQQCYEDVRSVDGQDAGEGLPRQ